MFALLVALVVVVVVVVVVARVVDSTTDCSNFHLNVLLTCQSDFHALIM